MKTFLPGQIASAADVNANFKEHTDGINALKQQLAATPAVSVSAPLAGSATGTLTMHIENMTTPATSISGGVYVPLPNGPWKGIAAIEVTPRNTGQSPLMCTVEKVELTQVLIRFAKHDGLYYTTDGVPITLRITGWK